LPQISQVVELVAPNVAFRDSYRNLVAEFVERGEKLVPFVLGFDHADFDAFLERMLACSRGAGLPAGFVPHSTFWLVDRNARVLGVSSIRHSLTPALRREGGNIGYGVRPSARGAGFGVEILRHSLRQAALLGLGSVLVTCGKGNIASGKTILRNGGVLQSEEYLPDRGEVVQRYGIEIAPSGRAYPLGQC